MKEICWVSKSNSQNSIDNYELLHWSRRGEYPFIIKNGHFKSHQVVLDAAGGDAPLQYFMSNRCGVVFNVDSDKGQLDKAAKEWDHCANIIWREGNLLWLKFPDYFFDVVVCSSVLEHCANPREILAEIWRTLKVGGRLLLTFDVAEYARWNHTIDIVEASKIAAMFGLVLPSIPEDVLSAVFSEIDRKDDDPESVMLRVICLYADKGLE